MLQPIMQEAGDDVAQRHQDETILGHGYALATTWMGVGLQMTYNLEGFSLIIWLTQPQILVEGFLVQEHCRCTLEQGIKPSN